MTKLTPEPLVKEVAILTTEKEAREKMISHANGYVIQLMSKHLHKKPVRFAIECAERKTCRFVLMKVVSMDPYEELSKPAIEGARKKNCNSWNEIKP